MNLTETGIRVISFSISSANLLNSHPVLSAWLRQVKLRGPGVEVLPGNPARFTEHIQ